MTKKTNLFPKPFENSCQHNAMSPPNPLVFPTNIYSVYPNIITKIRKLTLTHYYLAV